MRLDYSKLKKKYLSSQACKGKIQELSYFSNKHNIDEAIREAVKAEKEGTKFSHQYRVKKTAIQETYKNITEIIYGVQEAKTFEDIISSIRLYKAKGYGRLACIDFGFRISSIKGIQPEVVYVQSGSYNGAKLLGLSICRDNYGGHYIKRDDIPEELQELDMIALENLLCWYAHEIGKKNLIS